MHPSHFFKGLAATIAAIAAAIPIYALLKDLKTDAIIFDEKLSFAITKSEITHSRSTDFVPRPKIEEQINKAFTNESRRGDGYTIVYGPKGVGKSELVDHVAIGKKGVVKVKVSSANNKSEVIQSIAKRLLGGATHTDLDIDIFIEAVRKSDITPTIIFDVECSLSRDDDDDDDVVSIVRSLSNDLPPYCRCIIVLSEANAVLQFGKDPREKFIYVDEMELDEAKQLLIGLAKAKMKYVFEKIGTSPLTLINLIESVSFTYSVEDYVVDVLRYAEKSLVAFAHQPILKALKDHSEGITPKYFKKQKDEGVDLSHPTAVGVAMKSVNTIVYRMELDKYMLMSTAHRTALKSYEPIITK